MKLRSMLFAFLLLILMTTLLVTAAPASPPARAQATFPTLPVVAATPTPGTPTIAPTFTVAPRPTTVGCRTPLNLIPGIQVVITGGLNVRAAPSLSAPLITYFSEERLVRLIGGPTCVDDYNWWQIGQFGGQPGADTGWVIEGSREGRLFIQPPAVSLGEACFSPLELAVGDTAIALTGTRLRNAARQNSYTVTVIPIDGQMTILEGPACADGINWWRVSTGFQTSGIPVEGWVAEGYPGGYFIAGADALTGEIEIPCVLPLTLGTGSRIAVNYRDGIPRRLRAEPNVNAEVTLYLPDEIALEITGGPVCSGGYNWWQVRVITTNFAGWIAEGRPGRYNIEIIAP